MASFGQSYIDHMMSRPVRLEWAGWSTTTLDLQRHGWSVSAHQDVQRMKLAIAIHHPHHGQGMTRIAENWLYEGRIEDRLQHVRLPMGIHLGREVVIDTGWINCRPDFQAIDAEPSFRHEITKLADLAHFAPMKSLEAPFVLPEADVDQLLQIILEKQQAAKTDYFRDLVRREGEILPAHTMSAQIISLKAA